LCNTKAIFKNIKIKKQFENDEHMLEKLVYSLLINLTMVVSSHVRNLHCFSHGKLSLLRQFPLM
jgi:hypothetical protein